MHSVSAACEEWRGIRADITGRGWELLPFLCVLWPAELWVWRDLLIVFSVKVWCVSYMLCWKIAEMLHKKGSIWWMYNCASAHATSIYRFKCSEEIHIFSVWNAGRDGSCWSIIPLCHLERLQQFKSVLDWLWQLFYSECLLNVYMPFNSDEPLHHEQGRACTLSVLFV